MIATTITTNRNMKAANIRPAPYLMRSISTPGLSSRGFAALGVAGLDMSDMIASFPARGGPGDSNLGCSRRQIEVGASGRIRCGQCARYFVDSVVSTERLEVCRSPPEGETRLAR